MQTACNALRQKVSDKSRTVIKDISVCDCEAASAPTESRLQQHTELCASASSKTIKFHNRKLSGSKEGAPSDKDSVTSKRTVEVTMLDRPQQLPHVDFASGKLRAQRLVLLAAAKFDGVENEADMFNQHRVGYCHGVHAAVPSAHSRETPTFRARIQEWIRNQLIT